MKRVFIFDIDGCLADDSARRERMEMLYAADKRIKGSSAKPSWGIYHEGLEGDPPMNFDILPDSRDTHVIPKVLFLTGRPEAFRNKTERWLRKQLESFNRNVEWKLAMRPTGDQRGSPQFKAEYLRDNGYNKKNIAMIFDDRVDCLLAVCEATGLSLHRANVLNKDGQWPLKEFDQEGAGLEDESSELSDGGDGLQHWKAYQKELVKSEEIRAADEVEEDPLQENPRPTTHAAPQDIMRSMAATFEERNKVYGDNYKNVAAVMRCLFPEGVPSELALTDHWHLFELIIVKLTRFANGGLTHVDSIHDAAVYAAMIESIIQENE